MNWKTFSEQKPVLTQAREELNDENFLEFVNKLLFKKPSPKPGTPNSLAKHAFEEIGWPEGHHYCKQGSPGYTLHTLQNPKPTISPRLLNRQLYWGTLKQDHIQAHITLQNMLEEYKTKTTKSQLS